MKIGDRTGTQFRCWWWWWWNQQIVDGNFQLSHSGQVMVVMGCTIVGLKDRKPELQRYLKNSIKGSDWLDEPRQKDHWSDVDVGIVNVGILTVWEYGSDEEEYNRRKQ